MIHPTFSATASATRQIPRTRKKAMVFRRLVTRMFADCDCTAECCGLIQEMCDFDAEMEKRKPPGSPKTQRLKPRISGARRRPNQFAIRSPKPRRLQRVAGR